MLSLTKRRHIYSAESRQHWGKYSSTSFALRHVPFARHCLSNKFRRRSRAPQTQQTLSKEAENFLHLLLSIHLRLLSLYPNPILFALPLCPFRNFSLCRVQSHARDFNGDCGTRSWCAATRCLANEVSAYGFSEGLISACIRSAILAANAFPITIHACFLFISNLVYASLLSAWTRPIWRTNTAVRTTTTLITLDVNMYLKVQRRSQVIKMGSRINSSNAKQLQKTTHSREIFWEWCFLSDILRCLSTERRAERVKLTECSYILLQDTCSFLKLTRTLIHFINLSQIRPQSFVCNVALRMLLPNKQSRLMRSRAFMKGEKQQIPFLNSSIHFRLISDTCQQSMTPHYSTNF